MKKLYNEDNNGHTGLNATKRVKKLNKWNKTQKYPALNIKDADDDTPFNQKNESFFQTLQRSILFNSNNEDDIE